MFFKNINEWEQKKLRLYSLIFNLIYFFISLIVPIIIVGCRYKIFSSNVIRLTGCGWILAIFVAVVGFRIINKLLNKLPESTFNEQRVKYTLLGIKALVVPILLLIAMQLLKNDFDLAYSTMWWCLFSFSFGIGIDFTCIKYLDRELELRKKAKEQNEIDIRKEALRSKE